MAKDLSPKEVRSGAVLAAYSLERAQEAVDGATEKVEKFKALYSGAKDGLVEAKRALADAKSHKASMDSAVADLDEDENPQIVVASAGAAEGHIQVSGG